MIKELSEYTQTTLLQYLLSNINEIFLLNFFFFLPQYLIASIVNTKFLTISFQDKTVTLYHYFHYVERVMNDF